jgi:hypothetical protein
VFALSGYEQAERNRKRAALSRLGLTCLEGADRMRAHL